MTAQTLPAGQDQGTHEASGHGGMPIVMVGMLLFIASEVMFFGGLFATYFNARAHAAPGTWGPPEGAHHLDLGLAIALTVILVSSSFTMQLGIRAIRRGRTGG